MRAGTILFEIFSQHWLSGKYFLISALEDPDLKEHLRVLVGIGVLTPQALFVVVLWALGKDQGGIMTLTYLLLVSAVTIFEWNRQVGSFWVRTGLGWLSGSMMILSVFLPWRSIGGAYSSLINGIYESWFVPQTIVIGGAASIFSRYGGFITIAGLWSFLSIPRSCPAGGCPPLTLELGFWLALIGVGLSLLGRALNFPVGPRLHTHG